MSILFFWLRTPELSIQRVAERVQHGGHNIPEGIIRRRYSAGIRNLFRLFMPVVDYWVVYDNTEQPRRKVASCRKGSAADIYDDELYKSIMAYV